LQALYEGEEERALSLLQPDGKLGPAEAAAFGRLDRLRQLLAEDPGRANERSPDGFRPLHLAIFAGSFDAARLLVERGADVEALSTNERVRVRPLGTAAFVRSVEATRLLLEAGADVNGKGAGGFAALHSAAQNGDVELARFLLERGADRTVRNQAGQLPRDLGLADLLD
jgi:ankyrin repeat protein